MASSSQSTHPTFPPSAYYNRRQHPQRPGSSRRTNSSSYDAPSRTIEGLLQRHNRAASSSSFTLALDGHRINFQPASRTTSPDFLPTADSRMLSILPSGTVDTSFHQATESLLPAFELGSASVNMVNHSERPPSPVPTVDFSIIDVDIDEADLNPSLPGSYPSRFLSSSMSFSRGRPAYVGYNHSNTSTSDSPQSPSQGIMSLKSFLPRIWDALSTPGRTMFGLSSANATSPSVSPPSSRAPSPSAMPRRHVNQSWYTPNAATSGRNSPVYWTPGSANKGKGKSRTPNFFSSRNGSRNDLSEYIDYSELPPLDGEEGELIDDEACFIDVRAVHGIDIISLLPPELALHIFTLICPPPLPSPSNTKSSLKNQLSPGRNSINGNEFDAVPDDALRALLSCRLVSRTWCRLASDNHIWRSLFLSRWNIDLRRATNATVLPQGLARNASATLGKTWDVDLTDIEPKAKRVLGLSSPVVDAPVTCAPLRLDWRILYRERLELDRRWSGASRIPIKKESNSFGDFMRRRGAIYDSINLSSPFGCRYDADRGDLQVEANYEPTPMKISGHTDSVYCLEFDSRRIITGSRDRTIKVWSLRTGALLGSFSGVHRGSVLCLKFEKDWDRDWCDSYESEEEGNGDFTGSQRNPIHREGVYVKESKRQRTGFMVSGSSDCSVCVWDLHLGAIMESNDDDTSLRNGNSHFKDESEREVIATVRDVLTGHLGGVLDLRIDKQWIVSCSKDAVIRVWNRKTLKLHRALRGHEGPVNAVGLQSGRVVSASGDGKMILWDIQSGERLRTFEGHDRGLACIEFKDDLIVSGSNDRKIKIWSASTGDCLRTLVGHDALVRALSFNPRTGRLVSASYDKTVKLWDLGSGKLIREFKGNHTSHIFDVKFDVSRIVSTSHDRKIVVLDFSEQLNTALFT
ncbi:F-box/WD repeat-containing protein pof11 [Psilocybe cubensis]|uniref:F-box domain-containing protein n=2 Tax=Psilocybe cubensis TaxID=181762 RepID=A0A8H7XR20_PSICU|nr:F-box/WD repeat-containing protein pof11 [Psilocybe cubensis]KAH9474789.1 F-box/WD repeat-containing protein pof11 [Psilocybe cubensis]